MGYRNLRCTVLVRTMSATFALAAAIVGAHNSALAQPLAISVNAGQTVSISGSTDSLRDAITDLCERAGVELRAYDAEDRPFSASFQDVPLTEALSRILRSEIFLVGLKPSNRGPVVSWLRVSGASGAVAGSPLRAGAPPASRPGTVAGIDIGVAADVVETALTSDDTIARSSARRVILQNLRSNPAALQRLLEREPAEIVEQLIHTRHAAEFLSSLQSVVSDVKDRTQIQTILRGLRLRQEAERRAAAR
jgi:hypothetical protein